MARSRPRNASWAVVVVAISVLFAAHALIAARSKAPTFDEPLYTFASHLAINHGDFRLNPEHPPLWKYVAGLPLLGQPLKVHFDSPDARLILADSNRQWTWTQDVLFRTPGNEGIALVQRARIAMALFPLLLALIVGRWAWTCGGPLAAVIATSILALDPSFLGHGALVVNDVAAACVFTAAGYLTWRLGVRLTWQVAALLALVCAAGAGVKFTCALLVPMVALPLLYRAAAASPWPTQRTAISRRLPRLAAVLSLLFVTALVTLALLWPIYRFRSAPVASGLRFDDDVARMQVAYYATGWSDGEPQMDDDPADVQRRMAAFGPGPFLSTVYWLQDRRLVPQAWAYGLTYVTARATARTSFLLGEYSNVGFRSYFPIALLVKTPVMILLLALTAAVVLSTRLRRLLGDAHVRWALVCLLVPPAIYLAYAVTSRLNIGIRHVLPIYPPLYVGIGVATAAIVRRWHPARAIVPTVLALLTVETLSVFPNYIGFFNLPSGGARGGLRLLSDSNLDWGQDLNGLARFHHAWRRANPGRPFYLCYFGTADPRAYGIDYINAGPGGSLDRDPPVPLDQLRGGVLAISATALQGSYAYEQRPALSMLREIEPLETINDTIYIYPLPDR